MAEAGAASAILDGPKPPAVLTADESRNDLVLEAYEATLARSLNERKAFEAAVQVYRSQNPDLAEEDARRAVANIICRKPLAGSTIRA